jgi:hypothetical protein
VALLKALAEVGVFPLGLRIDLLGLWLDLYCSNLSLSCSSSNCAAFLDRIEELIVALKEALAFVQIMSPGIFAALRMWALAVVGWMCCAQERVTGAVQGADGRWAQAAQLTAFSGWGCGA